MKFVSKIIGTILDKLQEVPALKKMKPLFDAMDAGILGPPDVTESGPHIVDCVDIKRYMSMVILALVPATLASIWFFGWDAIRIIAISYIVGGAVEVIFACVRKHDIHEGFLITGLIFPLVLPPTTPSWIVAVGVVFGVMFGKEMFGGTGRNIFNPALVGRLFITLAFPAIMTTNWQVPFSDATTAATPLSVYKTSVIDPNSADTNLDQVVFTSESTVREFYEQDGAMSESAQVYCLGSGTFKEWEKHNPEKDDEEERGQFASCFDLLVGKTPGSMGETCRIVIILGGIFLMLIKVSNWRIPVCYIGSAFLFALIGNHFLPDKIAPPVFQLLTGGLLFGAMFMATDPITAPFTQAGRYAFGISCGLLTVLIRSFSGNTEGVMFSIVIMNAFNPLIDQIVLMIKYRPAKT